MSKVYENNAGKLFHRYSGRGKSFETDVVPFARYSHLFVKFKHALFKHSSSNQNKVFSYIYMLTTQNSGDAKFKYQNKEEMKIWRLFQKRATKLDIHVYATSVYSWSDELHYIILGLQDITHEQFMSNIKSFHYLKINSVKFNYLYT